MPNQTISLSVEQIRRLNVLKGNHGCGKKSTLIGKLIDDLYEKDKKSKSDKDHGCL